MNDARRIDRAPPAGSSWDELPSLTRARVEARVDTALETLGDLALDRESLHAALTDVARRRGLGFGSAAELDPLPPFLSDFCLAHACRQRPPIEAAWQRLVAHSRRELLCAARDLGESEPETAVHSFYGDLWVERSGGASLLDTYMGLGPLRAWMQLVLRRRLLAARSGRVPAALDDRASAVPRDAEHELVREELRTSARELIADQWRRMSARDRALLESRVVDRELGIHTARRLGVSPAYVSRRFKELLADLKQRIAPGLERRGFGPEDLS